MAGRKGNNDNFTKILGQAQRILKEYDLCDFCLGRIFAKKIGVSSHKILGKKIKNSLMKKSSSSSFSGREKCHICKNILPNLQLRVDEMLEASKPYQYSTFLVGAILRPSTVDRDDAIRSKFKLRGIDSVKTDITRQISKKFAKKANKIVDNLAPDLTFTINFKNDSCELRARSVNLYGRYAKKTRDLPQKQKVCQNCNGKGCRVCEGHGISEFESVEGKISRMLYDMFGTIQAKFFWIGGENRSSLVLGKGRPFFVKLINPKIRRAKLPIKSELGGGIITVNGLKIIKHIPKTVIKFRSKVEVHVLTQEKINPNDLKKLKTVKNSPIVIPGSTPWHNSQKLIHDVKYKKTSTNSFSLFITADAGIPFKNFVEGPNVNPNLSTLLNNRCSCKVLDYHEIQLQ